MQFLNVIRIVYKTPVITCSRISNLSWSRNYANQVQWLKPKGQYSGVNIYNCAASRKVPLVLPCDSFATWYTCGPTVYDSSHLGHASCYVKLDIIQRILRKHFNINLVTAMNITDIDDKIIARSIETGIGWQEISEKYEEEFWLDMQKLNVDSPNIKLRVTENIPKIISFIENILEKGLAYVAADKSVYFNVKKYPIYGKLQKINVQDNTVSGKCNNKHAEADFALWKSKKTENEPSWQSPWGAGRPGWHIECSALASAALGSNIDFHAGGLDLRFPHHENEETQCCVYHNTTQWVNYWVHAGQLNIKGQTEKMSKSLKNTISISDMLKQYGADEFRMACLMSNYKNTMEYSDELMETASNTLRKFKTFRTDCQAYLNGTKQANFLDSNVILQNLKYATKEIDEALQDDFNTAYTVSVLSDQVSSVSRCINSSSSAEVVQSSCLDTVCAVKNFVEKTLCTYGFLCFNAANKTDHLIESELNVSKILTGIINSRSNIRQRAIAEKSSILFEICDELRKSLLQQGIEIRDHNNGSSWTFVNKNK